MIIALFAATVFMADATAALQATSTQSSAASTSAATATATPKKAGNQADLICKSEPVLGSRLPVKKCRTSEQAASDKANAREELERAQGAMAQNPH